MIDVLAIVVAVVIIAAIVTSEVFDLWAVLKGLGRLLMKCLRL